VSETVRGVSLEDFQDFLSALKGKSMNINDKNFLGLLQLSEEFGFQVFFVKISNRRRLLTVPDAQRVKYLPQIVSLEEQVGQHEHQLAALQSMLLAVVRRFEADLTRLSSELKAVHDTKNSEGTATQRSGRKKSPPAAIPPTASAAVPSVPSLHAQSTRLDSLIVTEYPPLFEEFRTKR
jgi:hypothetical protein